MKTTLARLAAAAAVILLAVPIRPAAAADETLCGKPGGSPEEVLARITRTEKLPEVYRGTDYIAYEDKPAETVWTFTLPVMPAHPAVVCRRPKREGNDITLDMGIACRGPEQKCAELRKDFEYLNYQMMMRMKGEQPAVQPR